MNLSQKKIAIQLLGLAAEEFSNHSCNDYELPNTPQNYEIVQDMHKKLDISEIDVKVDESGKLIFTSDALLMQYLVDVLKEEIL